MAIQISNVRANKYDKFKVAAMSKKLFSESDWRTSLSNGTADQYITALMRSDSIDPNDFYTKYNLYYGDPTTKMTALYNETFADKENIKSYQTPLFDNSGNYVYDENGKQLFENVDMTEYDYNKKMIHDSNKIYAIREDIIRQEQERKNRQNFLSDVGAIIGQLGASAYQGLEGFGSLAGALLEEVGETTWQGIKAPFVDKTNFELFKHLEGDETFAETLNKWYTDNALGDDLQVQLDQFSYNNTHFYDENGEMTTAGRWLLGTADTIGKMLPTLAISYATGGAGGALMSNAQNVGNVSKLGSFLTNNAGTMGQLAFYGSNVFGRTVSDQYEYYASQGISITSAEIVSNALVKTALQLGVEAGLSKLLGPTGLDVMMWGKDPKTNILRFNNANLTKAAFGRLSKDALQEGLEETLQETSDWFVDAAHHFINHDFQSTEWNWQNIADAFVIAMITSIAGNGAKIVGTKRVNSSQLKENRNGELVKDKNGEYEYKKLNKIASWEYSLDLQSFTESIAAIKESSAAFANLRRSDDADSKSVRKAMSEYSAAYYEAVSSLNLLSSIYGEMGQERFNKANEILTKIRENVDSGAFDSELRKESQEFLVNSLTELQVKSKLDSLIKIQKAQMTEKTNVTNKHDDIKTSEDEKVANIIKDLGLDSVVTTKDGNNIVRIENVLLIPENLLKNANEKVIMASVAEQELADELTEGVVTKSKYFKNELGIVTDLYRQYSGDKNADEYDAIYTLIFDPAFFETVLSLNERSTTSFVLRLNKFVGIVGKKTGLKENLLNKRIQECRERWINAAFNYYSNNLEKDASLFTASLTTNERDDFNKKLANLLSLYNMGKSIITNPKLVKDDVWQFIERRINGLNVDSSIKDELKRDIRDSEPKKRQKALNIINEYYNGAFNTLYNGNVYMPKTSVGNSAFNAWLERMNLNLKTLFNENFLTDEEIATLGENYTTEDIITLRQMQFETLHSNMSFDYENGNIVVNVDGEPDGFELYKDLINVDRLKIVSGKNFKIGETEISERSIITSLQDIATFIKDYLKEDFVKDNAHQFLTMDDVVNHPEYLNDAVRDDIASEFGNIDKVSTYRYFQKQLTNDTNGKQCLILKQDGTVVIGNMSEMSDVLKKRDKFPTNGRYYIKDFIHSKYLTGSVANVMIEFIGGRDTDYSDYELDGDRYVFVNKITIGTKGKSDDEIRFAILHEFQHALQTELHLTTGTTGNILSYFSKADKKEIIKTVKELSPELFNGVTTQKTTETFVNNYLYHGSGEFQAMGIGNVGIIGFYPLIFSRKNGKTTITFRNGKSFTTTGTTFNAITAQGNIVDRSKGILNKYYSSYNLEPATIMNSSLRLAALRNLRSKFSKDYKPTIKERLQEMYCLFKSNKTEQEFNDSNIIGVQIDDKRYAIKDIAELEYLLSELNSIGNRFPESKVNVMFFTFQPKNLKTFNPLKSDSEYGHGYIEIDDKNISNKRNLQIPIDEPSKTLSKQESVAVDSDINKSTMLDILSQQLDENVDFKTDEETKKASAESTKTADTTEAKIPKAEGKIVDRRPKSERGRKFVYDSKKYSHSRTPIGEAKNPTKIIGPKDIDKDVADGKPFGRTRGDYVYRKFVERRYYTGLNGVEKYRDIFDYYGKKERRHTLSSEKDSNLQYALANKGKNQITMSPRLREFYIASTDVKLDPVIYEKIKSGTLKVNDLISYVIETPIDQVDNATFRLIAEKIFDNDNFKNIRQLYDLIYKYGSKMSALYLVLKDGDFDEFLTKPIRDFKEIDVIWEFAVSQSKYRKELLRIEEGANSGLNVSLRYYNSFKSYDALDPNVLTKEQVYQMLRLYKSDIASGSQAFLKARTNTYKDSLSVGEGYKASRFGSKSNYSLNTKVSGRGNATFLDSVSVNEDSPEADTMNFAYDGDTIYNELMDVSDGIGQRVYRFLAEKLGSEGHDFDFIVTSLNKYQGNLRGLSDNQMVNLYQKILEGFDDETLSKLYYLAEMPGFEDIIIEDDPIQRKEITTHLNKVINYGSKVQGIKRRLVTIQKYVRTKSERRLILKDNSDILNDDLTLKTEAYRNAKGYKSIEIIDEIAYRIRDISKAAKSGVYLNTESYRRYIEQLKRNEKKLDKIYKTVLGDSTVKGFKFVSVSTEDGNVDFRMKNQSEVPTVIRQILSTGLTRTGRSKIQELSSYHESYNEDGSVDKVYDDRYLKLTMKHLLDSNADLLNEMSQDEAEDILNFYVSDDIIISDVDSQIVSETVRLTCAYLLGESRHSEVRHGEGFERFNFNESLVKKVEAKMMEQAHMSAAMLSNQRTIIKLLQPEKILKQNLARNLGFKLDETDEKNLESMLIAMKLGKKADYEKAKEVFETKLIKDYPYKTKQDAFDKLLSFERVMMLSNPGTWLRNQLSNAVVTGGNMASYKVGKTLVDLTTKVFPKTKEKLDKFESYKLDKEVSKTTLDFIDEKFVNNGFLKETLNGVSKYDVYSENNRETSADSVVDMIARNIHSNIRRTSVFKNKGFGKFANLCTKVVYWGISDDKYVQNRTKKYLGKIIEEDYERARKKAAAKGRVLTLENYLKEDKTNLYGLSKPVISAFIKAIDLSCYDYMKTSNFLTAMERAIRENTPKGAWFMYKQVFPFLASSWNWCVEGMRYTPLGLANAIYKLAKLENTINQMDNAKMKGRTIVSGEFAEYLQIRNIGKGTIGSFTFILGLILANLGWAGIDEEDDEYKLFVGDVKININDVIGSQGIMLGIAIGHNIEVGGNDIIDVLSEAFNQVFRDSIFQDFIDTFRYDTGFGDFMWSTMWDIPAQFWPNVLRTIASISHRRGIEYSDDPIISKLQRLFLQMVPVPAEWAGANTKVNVYTGKVESFFNDEFFQDVLKRFTPLKVSRPSMNKNELESIGLGVKKSQLKGKYIINDDTIELSSNERTKLNVMYGKLNNSDLTKLFNNGIKVKVKGKNNKYEELYYRQMSDDQKSAAVETIMSNNSTLSKIYILTSSGKYKYYASKSEYDKLKKLGIVKNIYLKDDKKEGFVKIN